MPEQKGLFGSQSLPMALAAIAGALFLPDDQLLGILLSIAVHEGGHLMIAWLLGAKELHLCPGPMGFIITYLPTSLSPFAKTAAAAAGPFAGLILYYFLRTSPLLWAREAARLSCILSVLNLLPLRSLDGGIIVMGLLEAALEPLKAEEIAGKVEVFSCLCLFFCFFQLSLISKVPIFLFYPIALLLFCCGIRGNDL